MSSDVGNTRFIDMQAKAVIMASPVSTMMFERASKPSVKNPSSDPPASNRSDENSFGHFLSFSAAVSLSSKPVSCTPRSIELSASISSML